MSKRSYEERWGPHSHCLICGNAIPEGEKYCSESCKLKYEEEMRKASRQQKISYVFIVAMAALLLIMFILPYLLGQ
ncbi:MAG: DUF2116 family Zn-ribbon domain-containing protein [Candidatus Verstraetearchaeota archaeon]|nr:DUF2116 family Zn-ribbon domain-containing protein [Candidatus Verstraetearchaeota archaeon]